MPRRRPLLPNTKLVPTIAKKPKTGGSSASKSRGVTVALSSPLPVPFDTSKHNEKALQGQYAMRDGNCVKGWALTTLTSTFCFLLFGAFALNRLSSSLYFINRICCTVMYGFWNCGIHRELAEVYRHLSFVPSARRARFFNEVL